MTLRHARGHPERSRGVTLAELNACTQPRFVETLGWIFEASPWVAERAWHDRPFASVDDLHRAMTAAMDRATPDERLALLCAHPDLGTRVAHDLGLAALAR